MSSEMSEIAEAQAQDLNLQELKKKMDGQRSDRIGFVVEQGVLYRRMSLPRGEGQRYQVVVPESLITIFLQYYHDNPLSGHLGRMKTLLRVLEVAWWPTIRRDVTKHVKECIACQIYKPSNQKPAGFLQSTTVEEPGYMLGIDVMGPFPRSKKGNTCLVVIVDYYTKWVEVFPLHDGKTHRIVQLLTQEIFTRWGTPKYLVSDRGAQFTCGVLIEVCKKWGVTRKLTTSYHPQSNLTERVNRTLKPMIASFVGQNQQLWDQWLPEFRFAINSAKQETTGFTPAELMLGRVLKGPLDRLVSKSPSPGESSYSVLERQAGIAKLVRERVKEAQGRQAKSYNARRRCVIFSEGDLVWVRSHPISDASVFFFFQLN
ncbi:UNVERIFIED_CONTAM: hypothetical protein FKN15_076708 [Acipenser sinensis]